LNAIAELETLTDGRAIEVVRAKAARQPTIVPFERDRRTANHMDQETKIIYARGIEWGQWARRQLSILGYPSESYYHKWAALKIAPNAGFDGDMPPRIAAFDKAVAQLGEIDRSVIWRYFVEFRPLDIWKRLAGITSKRHFDKVLKRAMWRLDGMLKLLDANQI